jgi:hypothetical protein
MKPETLEDVRLLQFDRIKDARGNLSFFENNNQVPFIIQRVEYFYDIPGGARFEGYACKKGQEVIVALSGSFDVVVDTGTEKKYVTLNRSYLGLYIPPMAWRQIKNFSTNSLALVVSSSFYNASDCVRDFKDFIRLINE